MAIINEQTPEQVATRLVALLKKQLAEQEDAASAVDVYKTINWIMDILDEVKQTAVELAQADMEQNEVSNLRTPHGSAGWTEPKARQLNERAWLAAIARDPELMRVQRDYDRAAAGLQQAQEPFLELPEPRFFIR